MGYADDWVKGDRVGGIPKGPKSRVDMAGCVTELRQRQQATGSVGTDNSV